MGENAPEWFAKLHSAIRSTRGQVIASPWQVAREVAALNYLQSGLGLDRFLPPIGGWSVDYSVAAAVLDAVRQHGGPTTLVELGSGAGTPWFATMAQQAGGHLVSVEHDPEFVAKTSAVLAHYDLLASCTVVHAELTGTGDDAPWYAFTPIETALGDRVVDVLIVDGPPGDIGPQSRRQALFAFEQSLAENALVILDDVVREEEKETLADWEHFLGERMQKLPLLDRAATFRVRRAAVDSGSTRRADDGTLGPITPSDAEEQTSGSSSPI